MLISILFRCSTPGWTRTSNKRFLRPPPLPIGLQGLVGELSRILLVRFELTHEQILSLSPLPIGLQEYVLAGKEGIEPPNFAFKVRWLCLFAYFPSAPQIGIEPMTFCSSLAYGKPRFSESGSSPELDALPTELPGEINFSFLLFFWWVGRDSNPHVQHTGT